MNWCYAICDSLVLPIVAIVTFLWTIYQEWRYHEELQYKPRP